MKKSRLAFLALGIFAVLCVLAFFKLRPQPLEQVISADFHRFFHLSLTDVNWQQLYYQRGGFDNRVTDNTQPDPGHLQHFWDKMAGVQVYPKGDKLRFHPIFDILELNGKLPRQSPDGFTTYEDATVSVWATDGNQVYVLFTLGVKEFECFYTLYPS